MRIGPHILSNHLALAPMAGVTDRSFRALCRSFGAAIAPSEMLSADERLWNSPKSRRRRVHVSEAEPRIVQIAGAVPEMMARAARENVAQGAQIIDINMGCPAKKVCKRDAGSALLRDETLVRAILESVVDAVAVPVTLKIRTGWSPAERNGVRIARIAEAAGVQALAVHGRTRACRFKGSVEHETTRRIKQAVSIPVFANGDIRNADDARRVLEITGADGIMIGRAAQGRPWIFRELIAQSDPSVPGITTREICDAILAHLDGLYRLYGERTGVRVARKHLGWYCAGRPAAEKYRRAVMKLERASEQLRLSQQFFAAQRLAA